MKTVKIRLTVALALVAGCVSARDRILYVGAHPDEWMVRGYIPPDKD